MTEQWQVIKFDKCPACGSTERLIGSLAGKIRARGLLPKNVNLYVEAKEGAVKDPRTDAGIPIGSKMPAYRLFFDVCRDCGCYYVAKMEIGEVTATVVDIRRPPDLPFMGKG